MKILVSWSSGKDSAWMLHVLRSEACTPPAGLLTTVNESADRVAMHAVRSEVLRAQAEAAGLPLTTVPIPSPCPNEVYEERMAAAVRAAREQGYTHVAFGDLFLEDVRRYREERMAGTGLTPIFPLWLRPTRALAEDMLAAGLEAYLTCVDPRVLPASFAGRQYDARLLSELPDGIDPCGERGEFHTCVVAGPMFSKRIDVTVGQTVEREGFVFSDLSLRVACSALLSREVLMLLHTCTLACAVATGALLASFSARTTADNTPRPGVDWPQFRGIHAAGISENGATPASWNVAEGKNVLWKTEIPGLGLSSPVVWGDQLFVSTAISGTKDATLKPGLYGEIASVPDDTPHEWRVYALNKKTGAILWQQIAHTGVPKIKRHPKNTHANSTLATDGQRLIAFFGSEGLYAYDLKGKLLWQKDLGVLDAGFYMVPAAQWETGSSPVIHDGIVVIQADVQKGSFIAAFDATNGKEKWRVTRTDVPTWSTPTIHQVNGQTQLVVNGMRQAGAYDLKTGKEIWILSGGGDIPVPTPVASDGLIYITNAHGQMSPLYAIRDTATGNVSLADGASSNAGVAWSYARGGSYMCTPLVYRGLVYVVTYNGVLSAYDAKTGERKYQERLAGGTSAFTASPVASDGKVYLANEDGQAFVIKAGPSYELQSLNDMGSAVLATPAISEGRLLFRTQQHLMSIGTK